MPKKLSLEEMIKKVDDAKKVNPLDLSSDQDLTIALMNLISMEEHFFFTGAKTQKTGYYDMINTIRDIRKDLMARVVDKKAEGEIWCISKHLLAASMRLLEVGTKALSADKKEDAYSLFNKAYDLYSLFWGLNMKLIDVKGVEKTLPDMKVELNETNNEEFEEKTKKDDKDDVKESKSNKSDKNQSLVQKLGNWVKNSINCCIE